MPSGPTDNTNCWVVTVEEDPETKDLLLPLPDDMLSRLGWTLESNLIWTIDEQGRVCITCADPK